MEWQTVRENDEGRLHRVHAETECKNGGACPAVAIEHYNETIRTCVGLSLSRENIDVSG